MKVGWIVVLYHTPRNEIERLKKEIASLDFADYKMYFVDNTVSNRGFAAGVNEGIRRAKLDNVDIFIVSNPDISIKHITAKDIEEGLKHFDIFGFSMKQDATLYYGGEIDKWRLSGGLNDKKPSLQLSEVDFISGSLMIIQKKVIEKIGFFDEDYHMYYEDVEYCYRAKKSGFKIGVNSSVYYEHFENSKGSSEKNYLLAKNRLKFFLKHSSFIQRIYELMRLPKTVIEERSHIVYFLQHDTFYLNFFSLNLSSFLSKLLNFFLFIFLIRYLNAQEYGIYTLVWAQVTLLAPLVDLGTTSYGVVYLSADKKNKFSSLFTLRFILSISVLLLTLGLAFLMHLPIKTIVYVSLTSAVIIANMFSGSYLIANSIHQTITSSSALSSVFNILLISSMIIILIITKKLGILFVCIFLFYNLYSLVNWVYLKKRIKELSFSFDKLDWIIIAKKSYVFVLISLFAGLYFKIDVFVLNYLKGESSVGIYSAGYKFFEALMFIPGSYNVTSTPLFAQLAKSNKKLLISKIKKDLVFLFLLGIAISGAIAFFAPYVLPFVLKKFFSPSITVAQIVIFALPLVLMSSVFLNVLYVIERAYVVVLLFFFQVVTNLVLNMIFIPQYSYFASAYITLFSELVNFMILSISTYYFLKKYKSHEDRS